MSNKKALEKINIIKCVNVLLDCLLGIQKKWKGVSNSWNRLMIVVSEMLRSRPSLCCRLASTVALSDVRPWQQQRSRCVWLAIAFSFPTHGQEVLSVKRAFFSRELLGLLSVHKQVGESCTYFWTDAALFSTYLITKNTCIGYKLKF